MVLVRGLTPTAHLQHIFALTVFEDYIYWSDWETSTIERCHKYTGKANKTLLSTIHRPMDLQVIVRGLVFMAFVYTLCKTFFLWSKS